MLDIFNNFGSKLTSAYEVAKRLGNSELLLQISNLQVELANINSAYANMKNENTELKNKIIELEQKVAGTKKQNVYSAEVRRC